MKKLILLKVIPVKNIYFATISILIMGLKFQNYFCNGYHGSTMFRLNLTNIAIATVKSVDYRCIIHDISKSEVICLLENSVLDDCGYIYIKCISKKSLAIDSRAIVLGIYTFFYKKNFDKKMSLKNTKTFNILRKCLASNS